MQTAQVHKLLDGAKILPKILYVWVGCSNVTDDRRKAQMDVNVTQLLNWSSNNHMNVNFKKTKKW